MTADRPGIAATERSVRILEALREDPGASLGDLARTVDISKSAVYKHVTSLLRVGYLVREDDGYYLSVRFLRLGFGAREWLARPALRDAVTNLAATTGHTASFVVAEPDGGVYAVRTGGPPEVAGEVVPGERAPYHASASGKAILAFSPPARREGVLGEGDLRAYTDKTMTEAAALERALEGIRDRRVAFDREEFVEGCQSVASPVIGPDSHPIGAISVTGSTTRLSGKRLEEDVVGLVTSTVKGVETELLPTEPVNHR